MQDTTASTPATPLLRGIAVLHVKRDPEGRAVFYPWRRGGRGRVVTDMVLLRRALRLAQAHRLAGWAVFFTMVLCLIIFTPDCLAPWWLAPFALEAIWYQVMARRLLAGLPLSPMRMTRDDLRAARMAGRDPLSHWLTLILVLPMIYFGVMLAWRHVWPEGLIGAVLALAALLVILLEARSLRRFYSTRGGR